MKPIEVPDLTNTLWTKEGEAFARATISLVEHHNECVGKIPPTVDIQRRMETLEARNAELLIWKHDAIEREERLIGQVAWLSGMVTGLLARLDEPGVEDLWKRSKEMLAEMPVSKN